MSTPQKAYEEVNKKFKNFCENNKDAIERFLRNNNLKMKTVKAEGPLVRVNGLKDSDNLYLCLFGNVEKFYSVKANYYLKQSILVEDPEIMSNCGFDESLFEKYKNIIVAFAESIAKEKFLDLV